MDNHKKRSYYYNRSRKNKGVFIIDGTMELFHSLTYIDPKYSRNEAMSILKKHKIGVPYSEIEKLVKKLTIDDENLMLDHYEKFKENMDRLIKVYSRIDVLEKLGI